MDARQMREIPIADFLNAMGIQPSKQKGNALWYSAPYRMERRPSFKVDINILLSGKLFKLGKKAFQA